MACVTCRVVSCRVVSCEDSNQAEAHARASFVPRDFRAIERWRVVCERDRPRADSTLQNDGASRADGIGPVSTALCKTMARRARTGSPPCRQHFCKTMARRARTGSIPLSTTGRVERWCVCASRTESVLSPPPSYVSPTHLPSRDEDVGS